MNDTSTNAKMYIMTGVLLFTLGLGYIVGYGNGRDSRRRRKVFAR